MWRTSSREKQKPSKKKLKVKMVHGARTTLLLLQKGEREDDSNEYINMRGWKSNEIRDFVAMKLGLSSDS